MAASRFDLEDFAPSKRHFKGLAEPSNSPGQVSTSSTTSMSLGPEKLSMKFENRFVGFSEGLKSVNYTCIGTNKYYLNIKIAS